MSEVPLYSPPRTTGGAKFENIDSTEICSGSEAGSYLRPLEFMYHSTLGLRAITKKKKQTRALASEVPLLLL
jgi:hypothetical protein